MESGKQFNRRAFVSLLAAISGLGLPVTGYMCHLSAMEPMTAQRHVWMSAHNSLGLVFMVAAIWHVILNRQALMRHLRAAAAGITGVSREAVWALALVALVLFIAVGHALHAG